METEIEKHNACYEAVEYRKQFKTFKEAWEKCHRGDWMLWIANKEGVDKRLLTLAKARCAKTVIHLMKDKRSIKAVEVAEAYGNGEASEEDLKKAYIAAAAVYADAAADAAAVYADAAAAYSADTAAYSADAAAYSAAYSADVADVARKTNQLQTANICRELLTEAIFEKLNIKQ
jgi:hypothetical protein